jgi:hypothetical protein
MATINELLDDLTLDEVEFYEDYTGEGIGEVYDNGLIGKGTAALYTILQRRTNPAFTIEEARKVKALKAHEAITAYEVPKETPEA